jgi:hypothetical protein
MNLSRFLLLLQLAISLVTGQTVNRTDPSSPAKQSEAVVRSLYEQVVTHQSSGLPGDADMKIFAPYLSKPLLHRINSAMACGDDWYRQYPDPNLKPAFGWLELGLFSGGNERATPQTFLIEKTRSDQDGSSRVYVRLTRTYSDGHSSIWRVAAIVTREKGHFVVDDVIYLQDKDYDEYRLSEALSAGCDGPRWVGTSHSKADLKQQK